MIRVIFFLILVAALAAGGAWLAERPGEVSVTWMGQQIEMSLLVAIGALALIIVAVMMLWSLLRLIWRSPRLVAHSRRDRRRRRGDRAVSRGLVAAASGDMKGARRFAGEADRFAQDAPLALLLRAQTAQLSGDRAQADAAFRAMANEPETRLLGLRGLYVEAQRRGDAEAGKRYAEEAARGAPALPWAGQAVFDFRCAACDWPAALAALDRNHRAGLIDRAMHRRHRAVLLTAQALAVEETDPAAARKLAAEAAKLAPDLAPASVLAARLAAADGEWRRAAKIVESAWSASPHPDLAEVYAHLRNGESARDRLARMRQLVALRPGDRDGALALARAAIDAQDFSAARAALAPLAESPTQRVALLMAELEEKEHGDLGRAREWMSRAMRVGGDPRWTADGMVSDRWLPVSPVSGRLDAFEWRAPTAEIAAAGPFALEPSPPPSPSLPPAPPALEVVVEPAPAPAEPVPAPAPVPDRAARPVNAPPTARAPAAPRRDAVIPLIHAPDDPGPDAPDPSVPAPPPGYPVVGR